MTHNLGSRIPQAKRDCSASFAPVLQVTLSRRTLVVQHVARHAKRGGTR